MEKHHAKNYIKHKYWKYTYLICDINLIVDDETLSSFLVGIEIKA
jgi:hypothetical protein